MWVILNFLSVHVSCQVLHHWLWHWFPLYLCPATFSSICHKNLGIIWLKFHESESWIWKRNLILKQPLHQHWLKESKNHVNFSVFMHHMSIYTSRVNITHVILYMLTDKQSSTSGWPFLACHCFPLLHVRCRLPCPSFHWTSSLVFFQNYGSVVCLTTSSFWDVVKNFIDSPRWRPTKVSFHRFFTSNNIESHKIYNNHPKSSHLI